MHNETVDIDLITGNVLRQARLNAGFTLQALAESSGVTYQQIQKYETGANRLSVSRLFLLTNSLGISASDFLQRVQEELHQGVEKPSARELEQHRFVKSETGRKVVSSLASIEDQAVLKSVLNLITSLNNAPRRP